MSSRETILAGIARLRARWWRVQLVRHTLQALFYMLLAAALALLVFEDLTLAALAAPLAVAAIIAAATAAWTTRPSAAHLAKALDDTTGLRDRVSSTVELLDRKGAMVEALTDEAAQAARDLEPAGVYPYAMPREGWWMPLPALLVAAVIFLPGLTGGDPMGDPEFEATVEDRLGKLDEMLSQERDAELSPKQKELLDELLKLQAEVDQPQLDRKDTQAEVAKVLDNLRKARDEEQKKELELKKLLKGMQEKAGTKDLAEFMMKGAYNEAMKKLKEELEELREKLEKMRKEGASPEELKQLEEQIKSLEEMEAKMLELLQLDMDLSMMGDAIDFLSDWDGDLGDLADLDPNQMLEAGEP